MAKTGMQDWIVFEVGTGYMDGFYSDRAGGEGALGYWHERRPKRRHMLCRVERDLGSEGIPDHLWLAEQAYLEEEGR